jgi:hypothetical protein
MQRINPLPNNPNAFARVKFAFFAQSRDLQAPICVPHNLFLHSQKSFPANSYPPSPPRAFLFLKNFRSFAGVFFELLE